jgi:hypothetical protein
MREIQWVFLSVSPFNIDRHGRKYSIRGTRNLTMRGIDYIVVKRALGAGLFWKGGIEI